MDTHLIGPIVGLLLVACFASGLSQWLKLPYTIILVIVGLIISFLDVTPHIHISHDVTFHLILPPLLFYGALHMDLERLLKNWKPIALLAIPGVLCSTFIIGFLLHKMWQIELIYALLFGALITPTDPISVLAILKKVGAPERLRIILEGESLFNDGTGVVVYSIILGIVTGHADFSLGSSVLKFLIVAGGGTIVGLVAGFLAYKFLKGIDDPVHEVTQTAVVAFGVPLLAEAMHTSGIIAVVVAGLIIGNYGKIYSMSDKTCNTLDSFWQVFDYMINSLLFIVIGLELQEISKGDLFYYWKYALGGVFALLLGRAIVVYPIVWFKNKISHRDLPWEWTHVLFWGGLKGSIPIALVVGMSPTLPYREFFLTIAFSIVIFSLVVQGLTIKPLVKKLGVGQ